MDVQDFWLLRKGWNDKLIYEQQVMRRAAYIIHCSLVSKPANLNDIWPLPGDERSKETDISDRMKELLRMQKDGTLKEILKKKK